MTVYFDMDGTIADLYGVEDVFKKLDNYNASPYIEAKPIDKIINMIYEYKNKGYRVGVISWLSKITNAQFDEETIAAKKEWLKKNIDIAFDELHLVPYGTNKYDIAKDKDGILVDDDERVRITWLNGKVINPKEI